MDTDEPYLELISVDDLQLLTDNWTQSASSMTIVSIIYNIYSLYYRAFPLSLL